MKLQNGYTHIYKIPCYAVIQSLQFSPLKRFKTLKLLWKFSFSIICLVTGSLKTWVVGPTANFTHVNIYFTAYSFHYMLFCCCCCCCCCCWVSKSCLTLWYHMEDSPPGSSVHGISQPRILGNSISRGSSQPRDQTRISCLAGEFFTSEPHGKPLATYTFRKLFGAFHFEIFPFAQFCHSKWPSSGEVNIESRVMNMGKGEERVRCLERVTWKLTLPYVK